MKKTAFLLTILALPMMVMPQTTSELASIWDAHHISRIFPSDVRHADVKNYIEQMKKLGIKTEEVGRSNAGREIYQMEFGHGPLRMFLWSQMHGDEPTATSSLFDIFAYLQKHKDIDWVKKIASTMTIRAVPMLNPDGAELYQRRNLQGIDINRDAINLATPEARLLKKLRDEWSPDIGFNLHNQQELTTAGDSARQAAISLLVVYGDEAKTPTDGLSRNERVASEMVTALNKFISGHIGRYDDEWTPSAFGDNFSAWGTPVILIETGALNGKDEMYLVKMNFIAIMTAIRSIVTGSEKNQSNLLYVDLPHNTSGRVINYVFRRANVVAKGTEINYKMSDIAAVSLRRRASFAPNVVIRSVGPSLSIAGLDEYDASGFNVIHRFTDIKTGQFAELCFYKRSRNIDWNMPDLIQKERPDAIFSAGKWYVGEGVVPRIKKQ